MEQASGLTYFIIRAPGSGLWQDKTPINTTLCLWRDWPGGNTDLIKVWFSLHYIITLTWSYYGCSDCLTEWSHYGGHYHGWYQDEKQDFSQNKQNWYLTWNATLCLTDLSGTPPVWKKNNCSNIFRIILQRTYDFPLTCTIMIFIHTGD